MLQVQFFDRATDFPVVLQRYVPQSMEEIMEVVQLMPEERIQERTVEKTIDDFVPCMKEEIIEVVRQILQECFVEETDVLVSRVMEKIIEVVKHMPQERVHGDTVQDVKRPPQEQVQSCTAELIVDAPVPHVEEILEVVKRQRVQSNTVEAAKFNPEETEQVIQRIEQGRIRGRGGGDKKICAGGRAEEIGDRWKWRCARGPWRENRDGEDGRSIARWRDDSACESNARRKEQEDGEENDGRK